MNATGPTLRGDGAELQLGARVGDYEIDRAKTVKKPMNPLCVDGSSFRGVMVVGASDVVAKVACCVLH